MGVKYAESHGMRVIALLKYSADPVKSRRIGRSIKHPRHTFVSLTLSVWEAEGAGLVQPGEEEALGRPNKSFPIPTRRS